MSQSQITRLIVRDLRVSMLIGIFERDKTNPTPLDITVEADVVLPANWQTDDYSTVLGYDKIVDMVRGLCAEGHMNLLETLAESIAARCLLWPQVVGVVVKVIKPSVYADCAVGVEISRSRA